MKYNSLEMKEFLTKALEDEPESKAVIEEAYEGSENAIAALICLLKDYGQYELAKIWEKEYEDDFIVQDMLDSVRLTDWTDLWSGVL